MECEQHKNMDIDEYKKKISNFASRFELPCFIINTLSLFCYKGWYYCYCNNDANKKTCLMCTIPGDFNEFELKLHDHILGYDYLKKYREKLYPLLLQIFRQKKDCVCCFLHQEYENKGSHWWDGTTWSVSVSESVRYNEKLQRDQQKKKKELGPFPPDV